MILKSYFFLRWDNGIVAIFQESSSFRDTYIGLYGYADVMFGSWFQTQQEEGSKYEYR